VVRGVDNFDEVGSRVMSWDRVGTPGWYSASTLRSDRALTSGRRQHHDFTEFGSRPGDIGVRLRLRPAPFVAAVRLADAV
jgi:hypothetical protein